MATSKKSTVKKKSAPKKKSSPKKKIALTKKSAPKKKGIPKKNAKSRPSASSSTKRLTSSTVKYRVVCIDETRKPISRWTTNKTAAEAFGAAHSASTGHETTLEIKNR